MTMNRRLARTRRACASITAGLAVALCAAASASAAAIPQGSFAGTTDPHFLAANEVAFRVAGQTIRDRIIYWRAACQSGSTFTDGTETPRLPVAGGAWHSGGSYDVAVPPNMSAHITVVEDRAHFTSPITAAGVWSVKVTVSQGAQPIDTCATGPVSWAAGTFAVAGQHSSLILGSGQKVGGAGYAQWETRAWQWDDQHLHFYPGVAPPPRTGASPRGRAGRSGSCTATPTAVVRHPLLPRAGGPLPVHRLALERMLHRRAAAVLRLDQRRP